MAILQTNLLGYQTQNNADTSPESCSVPPFVHRTTGDMKSSWQVLFLSFEQVLPKRTNKNYVTIKKK